MRDGERDYDKENIMEALPFVVTFVVTEDMVGLVVCVLHEFRLVVECVSVRRGCFPGFMQKKNNVS